ncbi:barstar family protein [Neobacillus sp. CF12]|uniref:barstar family protein n=1 Tax=Neobacillus sp. CF12 TaxID=3055864 RepID=UPI0025A1962D|nr:barstar family protein [Neobacillus sp. CF12]MDM5326901.1 barstar family protein [Neobacillus sp. CF12]
MSNKRESMVTIDISNVQTANELHLLLKEKLEFPDFYGENWDAFWDAITGLISMPNKLVFIGWSGFEKKLPSDAKIMKQCFIDYNEEFPTLKCDFFFNYHEN